MSNDQEKKPEISGDQLVMPLYDVEVTLHMADGSVHTFETGTEPFVTGPTIDKGGKIFSLYDNDGYDAMRKLSADFTYFVGQPVVLFATDKKGQRVPLSFREIVSHTIKYIKKPSAIFKLEERVLKTGGTPVDSGFLFSRNGIKTVKTSTWVRQEDAEDSSDVDKKSIEIQKKINNTLGDVSFLLYGNPDTKGTDFTSEERASLMAELDALRAKIEKDIKLTKKQKKKK